MPTPRGLERTLRLLTRTPNPAATEALDAGLRSDESVVRTAAARALSQRRGQAGVRTLLLAMAETPADVQESVSSPEAARRLRPGVLAALKGDELLLCKRACRYAHDVCDYQVLPVMVEQASKPDHAYGLGLATTALHIAKHLSEQIYSPATAANAPQEDPAFARRAAINALIRAVDSFGKHRHVELIEAFLLLVMPEDLVLRRVLGDPTHPAQQPLLETLRCCTAPGAMHIVEHTLLQEHPPATLLGVLTSRADRAFVEHLLGAMGDRPPLRATEQARRLPGFAWAEEQHEDLLLGLEGGLQANALRLAAATRMSKRRLATLAESVLRKGQAAGRVAACQVIGDLNSKSTPQLISLALADPEPTVVAAAASQLRKRGIEGSMEKLVSLLDHQHGGVKQAAQESLPELNYLDFREAFERLEEPARSTRGRLVGKADPRCADAVRKDLATASISQRLKTLEIAAALGIGDSLVKELTTELQDKDPAIRAAAARALASGKSDKVKAALRAALKDNNSTVREEAQAGLGPIVPIDIASNLVEGMRQEFPS